MAEKLLMDKDEMARTLKRIASEIIESNKKVKDIVLIGIQNRGVPLAERLAKLISSSEKTEVPVGTLDVSLHRDDIIKKGAGINMKKTDIPFSIDGKTVILVDDVISAGRTIRAALDSLSDFGRAEKIELVALIDRDCRELPIHPDFTGKKISTLQSDSVKVNVAEIDGVDKVIVK